MLRAFFSLCFFSQCPARKSQDAVRVREIGAGGSDLSQCLCEEVGVGSCSPRKDFSPLSSESKGAHVLIPWWAPLCTSGWMLEEGHPRRTRCTGCCLPAASGPNWDAELQEESSLQAAHPLLLPWPLASLPEGGLCAGGFIALSSQPKSVCK